MLSNSIYILQDEQGLPVLFSFKKRLIEKLAIMLKGTVSQRTFLGDNTEVEHVFLQGDDDHCFYVSDKDNNNEVFVKFDESGSDEIFIDKFFIKVHNIDFL